jgi:hypothetical protein
MQKLKEHAMRTSQKTPETLTTIGIDLGKNTFHLVGGENLLAGIGGVGVPAFVASRTEVHGMQKSP